MGLGSILVSYDNWNFHPNFRLYKLKLKTGKCLLKTELQKRSLNKSNGKKI